MARINYRLSEWLKRVDKSEAEYISRKSQHNQAEATDTAEKVETTANASAETATSNVRVVSRTSQPVVQQKTAVPQSAPSPAVETKQPASGKNHEVKLKLAPEGTGEPRPMSANAQTSTVTEVKVLKELLEKAEPTEQNVLVQQGTIEPEEQSAETLDIQESWSRLPHHLQVLFSIPDSEVAQRSYKTAFKDSRAELIERLLDPPLTLEDTARILNVCPTTVRRYTNRNLLKHYRTAGNQRRFRLSDVLNFMETNNRKTKSGNRPKQHGEEQTPQ